MTLPAALLDRSPPPPCARASPTPSTPAWRPRSARCCSCRASAGVLRVGFATEDDDALLAAGRRARRPADRRLRRASSRRPATRSRPTSRARTSRSTVPVDLALVRVRVPPHGARGRCAPRSAPGDVVTYGDARARGSATRRPRARSARRARPTRSRSSSRATASCRAAAASAATAAARTSSAGCSPTRARAAAPSAAATVTTSGSRSARPAARPARPARADQVDDVLPLGDLAEQRVLRRQLGVLAGDDEELAARRAGRLGRGLGHRHDALRVGEVLAAAPRRPSSRGRRCPSPCGSPPWITKPGDDPVERRARRRSPCRRGT